jgi:hypothetical protein
LLGLRHDPRDVRRQRALRRRVRLYLQRAVQVQRARIDRVADRLLDRDALACNRRLVNRRRARNNDAIDGHALARLNAHALPDTNLLDGNRAPSVVGNLHRRFGGGDLERGA